MLPIGYGLIPLQLAKFISIHCYAEQVLFSEITCKALLDRQGRQRQEAGTYQLEYCGDVHTRN
jgi:hypothetical protein